MGVGHYLYAVHPASATPFQLKKKLHPFNPTLTVLVHVYRWRKAIFFFHTTIENSKSKPPPDFVNLQPPRVSVGWSFIGKGRPDDVECLKVGDLYGLRATLFYEREGGWYLERPTEVKLIILINERVFTWQ